MNKLFSGIKTALISGIIVLLPATVTIFVIWFLIKKLASPISNSFTPYILSVFTFNEKYEIIIPTIIEIVSVLIMLILICLIGFISKYFLGKLIINIYEKIIFKIPFVNIVYKAVKQIVDAIKEQKKAIFQEVVLIEFPRKGLYSIGFLTSTAKGEVQVKTGEVVINVFVPTTPNPTSGFLVMVPEDQLKRLNMSVSQAMKFIVSGGAVVPEYFENEKLENKQN